MKIIKYIILIATLLFTLESHADVASQSQRERDLTLTLMISVCNKVVQFANEDENMKWDIYEEDKNNAIKADYLLHEYLEKKYSKADYEKILINNIIKLQQYLKDRHEQSKEMKNEKERVAKKYKELEFCRKLWDDVV